MYGISVPDFISANRRKIQMKKPVVLCIMDGYGKNDSDYGNAIAMAKSRIWISLRRSAP